MDFSPTSPVLISPHSLIPSSIFSESSMNRRCDGGCFAILKRVREGRSNIQFLNLGRLNTEYGASLNLIIIFAHVQFGTPPCHHRFSSPKTFSAAFSSFITSFSRATSSVTLCKTKLYRRYKVLGPIFQAFSLDWLFFPNLLSLQINPILQ